MNIFLKSAAARVVGRGYLSADHISTATGLDPVITISKNGGNFANPAAGASVMTEIESTGWYYFALGTGDVDTLGPLIIRGTHATMDNIEVACQVVETVTAANLTQINGEAQTATLDTIKADAAAVKVQTDKMAFTVANQVDSNVITKTGFSLSATGADLILKTSTFAVALAAAINELATYGLTALNTLLVTTGIKAATTAAPADMALNSTVAKDATVSKPGTAQTITAPADMALNSTVAKSTDLATVAGYLDTEIAAIISELAKVPKSDSNVSLNATALAAIKTALEAAGSHLTLVKAQTDKMAFTVANQIDANAQSVNDKTLTGDGSVATPWGPA